MALILGIETSTTNCSVALFLGDKLISERSLLSEKYSHSETLTIFIQGLFNDTDYLLSDLDSISVSIGPGSYTGLRIGVSTAKGLCYALNIPLISVFTLQSMSQSISDEDPSFDLYCPMIDARRMEVYSAFYDNKNNEVRKIQADIIDSSTFSHLLDKKIVFFGDGSEKCKDIINSEKAVFLNDVYPSAKNLMKISHRKFKESNFEDIAYFEPFYLKDFIAGVKKI